MSFITAAEAAEKWNLTERMVRIYCAEGRVQGAVLQDDGWFIPNETEKPLRKKRESNPFSKDPPPFLAKKLLKERKKKTYHGLYDYTQSNFTYSNNRLASNRLMRKQVDEIMKTGKVTSYSEPLKIDDLIEVSNHFICIDYLLETVMQPITQTYIKKLHKLLLYGTEYDRKHLGAVGAYRDRPAKLGGNKTPFIDTERLRHPEVDDWLKVLHGHALDGEDITKYPVPQSFRRITVSEAAALQGFPSGFIFCGSKCEQYRQIGNSVPPPFAYHIAKTVATSMKQP